MMVMAVVLADSVKTLCHNKSFPSEVIFFFVDARTAMLVSGSNIVHAFFDPVPFFALLPISTLGRRGFCV